ncbi:MAG: HEAT repeat domain-containing protein [Calditrichaeota bacterium]|nr:HEAT repeat domain-containing protein [Calditrichota bacterium]
MKTSAKILIVIFCYTFLSAQEIIPSGTREQNLQQRWSDAIKTQKNSPSEYLIIYTFERMMPENSYIGHFNSEWEGRKKLGEYLYPELPVNYLETLKGKDSHSDKNVMKELAMIFIMKSETVIDVDMSTIDVHYDLANRNVIWLGHSNETESINLVQQLYGQTDSDDLKKDFITAAGLHKSAPESYTFLKQIIENNNSSELREDAVFWIAELDNPKALPFLKGIALNDKDENVAEKAVFALYNIKSDESTDTIIDLAKNAQSHEVREKAIFWLGQLAGKKAESTLSDIIFDENETDLQEKAVFALSQLDKGQGIEKLIKVAKEHPNPKVRKKAIFWLGESGDDRALEALIDMVKR